jgi:hypothetical protein
MKWSAISGDGCDPGAPLAIQAQEVANLQGRCVRTEMAG